MKKKLNLKNLEVKSFVTNTNLENTETIHGGRPPKKSYRGDCFEVEPEPVDRITDNFCSLNYVCVTGAGCYVSVNQC